MSSKLKQLISTAYTREDNIDHLLQTGFETIIQAFELKSTTLHAIIKDQQSGILELKDKIKVMKEEIEILKQENTFYKTENEQLRLSNMKLTSSLQTTQDKLKTITTNNIQYNETYEHPLTERKETINTYNINSNNNDNIKIINESYEPKQPIEYHTPQPRIITYNTKVPSRSNPKQHHRTYEHTNLSNGPCYTSLNYNHRNNNSNPHLNRDYNYTNINSNSFDNNTNHNNKDQQHNHNEFELTNEFLRKCQTSLNANTFNQIVDLFQNYKDNLINDDNLIYETRSILEGHDELLEMFESLFLVD